MKKIKFPATGPWKTHFPTDGSEIGGVDPASFGFFVVPGEKQSVLMNMSGTKTPGGFPAWMLYPASPIQLPAAEPTMNMELEFKLWVDQNTQTAANVIETDTIFVIKGADGKTYSYNCSAQVVIASGMLEVGSPNAGWFLTGIKVADFLPNTEYTVRISYTVNTVTHVGSVNSYTVNDTAYIVPSAGLNVPGAVSTWTPGAYLQLQQGSLPASMPFTLRFGDEFIYRIC
jgi:hypothetical protein